MNISEVERAFGRCGGKNSKMRTELLLVRVL